VLPQPGSGPSKKSMDKGFLKIVGIGKGEMGKESKIIM